MTFDYNIVRSKRKTVTVSVSQDNIITVRCPLSMSNSVVDDFINSKSEWLYKVLAENNVKRADCKSVLDYKEILICGEKLPLIFLDKNKIESDAVYVKDVAAIKKTLIKFLSEELISFAEKISSELNISCKGFCVKAYKSRWGCCDVKGEITLNCLLTMLPLYLQRYVIIHELCHTLYFNHSQKFWKLVSRYEPNYKVCRSNLKSFNYLTKLY